MVAFTVAKWLPISVLGGLMWGGWIIRQVLGAFYRPAANDHTETTSVLVPTYREDPAILERCFRSWIRNNPDEVLLIIEHTDRTLISMANRWAEEDPRVRVLTVPVPDKRHALAVGMRQARFEIFVLTDSDTMWDRGFLPKVLMGFADGQVGGVGCRQNVYMASTALWRRVADWMLDVRFLHYMPATARVGAAPCISGRTAAYRRAAVLPLVDEMEFETFWGKRCISGDDGRLTWLVLRNGWKTTYQLNARSWTVFPNNFRGFVQQRIRWSRNSYRCYARAAWEGWLWRQPVITSVSVIQNLAGPFTLTLATFFLIYEPIHHEWGLAFLALSWLMFGRAIKSARHLFSEPRSLLYLPLMTLVFVLVMIPIKWYALFTMNKQGWITRRPDMRVAQGQGMRTLDPVVGSRARSAANRAEARLPGSRGHRRQAVE